jgi:hypothetical protein
MWSAEIAPWVIGISDRSSLLAYSELGGSLSLSVCGLAGSLSLSIWGLAGSLSLSVWGLAGSLSLSVWGLAGSLSLSVVPLFYSLYSLHFASLVWQLGLSPHCVCHLSSQPVMCLIFIYFISPLFNQVGQLRTSSHLQLRPGQDKAKQCDKNNNTELHMEETNLQSITQ